METLVLDELDGTAVVLEVVITHGGLVVDLAERLGRDNLEQVAKIDTAGEISLDALNLHAPLREELVGPSGEGLRRTTKEKKVIINKKKPTSRD
jgi:hypothetical protein